MRCKACNAEMSAMDLRRKEEDGTFMDLCTGCYPSSQMHVYEVVQEREEVEEMAPAPPQEGPQGTFDKFVEKHNLMASWADGLGLKMTGEERMVYFYDKCYAEYLELRKLGYGTAVALERACGVMKADRRREYSGASFAHTSGDIGATGGSDVSIATWMGADLPHTYK